jgi:membrane protease subunit (stomatin/prohibitin family)
VGLFGMFRKQFIDVIEWVEESNGVLSYRYPMQDREIQNGAQLTVRDSQLALFVNEGKIADLFETGSYTISTRNLPMLTNLKNWDKGFESPFKSDLYFFSTRDQLDQRWGTPNAIIIRDKDFGPMRVRAHGTYSYRIKNPKIFFNKVCGTREAFTTEELEGQLRAIILTAFSTHFGATQVSFIDMAANQQQFSDTLKQTIAPSLVEYGIELQSFLVQSVSLPDELQSHFDKMASMRMVGDLRNYAHFQAADSISIAAKNEGGVAGAGASMGVGMAMAQSMTNSLPQASAEDPMKMIQRLHELMKAGAITEAEFNAKKAELLSKVK